MDQTQQIAEIIASLQPMFEQARKEGLFFYTRYQGLWFSPDELKALMLEGQFIWGPVNWILRDPQEGVLYYKNKLDEAHTDLLQFENRIQKAKEAKP